MLNNILWWDLQFCIFLAWATTCPVCSWILQDIQSVKYSSRIILKYNSLCEDHLFHLENCKWHIIWERTRTFWSWLQHLPWSTWEKCNMFLHGIWVGFMCWTGKQKDFPSWACIGSCPPMVSGSGPTGMPDDWRPFYLALHLGPWEILGSSFSLSDWCPRYNKVPPKYSFSML